MMYANINIFFLIIIQRFNVQRSINIIQTQQPIIKDIKYKKFLYPSETDKNIIIMLQNLFEISLLCNYLK
jgi:predicted nucleic acid-binding protein